jgi:hypothetical protein
MPTPALIQQTTYAELVERSATAAFNASFKTTGAFTHKTINGRKYWYFQSTECGQRTQRYVGVETPELLKRIEQHQQALEDERERRSLVSTLARSFRMPHPTQEIGSILEALASAGVFRLNAVLVGTVAYQSYSAMLGTKLPFATIQTSDVDIAQFKHVSVAVEDQIAPLLDVLQHVDKTFRPVPTVHRDQVTSYAAKGGFRVDFLTPNDGPDTDKPQRLPALQTDAQPLRFLGFLIRDPEPAVVLHGAGVYVTVPAPQRYAVHKLMIARRRQEGTAKRNKDVHQAEALLGVLLKKRRYELRSAWNEAAQKGKAWRQLLQQGLEDLSAEIQQSLRALLESKAA